MIWHDNSYINSMFAVDYGFAKIDVHSLRLSIKYTEEQMEANRQVARETLDVGNHEAWYVHCKLAQECKANMIYPIVEALSKQFKVYQFSDEDNILSYGDKWDLFFWCNDKSNTMRDDNEIGRDYSYVTLSFNDESMTHEERNKLLNKVLEFIESLNTDIDVAVQHDLYWNKEKVAETIKNYCKENIGGFIQYNSIIGKIKELKDGKYGFFKKGAKKYGYVIGDEDTTILKLAVGV